MSNQLRFTIQVEPEKINEIKKHYQKFLITINHPYVLFAAQKNNVMITCFFNTKGKKNKITFVGEDAFVEAQKWQEDLLFNEEVKDEINPNVTQIGSDESGVGDFFGPLVVCAAHVNLKDIPYLKKLKITDSKKMSDEYILKITPRLIRRFSYSVLILHNEKYNLLRDAEINANEMKARLHNQALLNLKKKFPTVQCFFIDQFVNENKYYQYLKNEKEIVRNLVFKTNAESEFMSVALASVIARFVLLKEFAKMNKKYKVKFPLGASKLVDEFAQKFVNNYGVEELNKVCKKHFANYDKIVTK